MKAAALPKQGAEPALVQTEQAQYQSSQGIHVAGSACSIWLPKYSRSVLAGVGHMGYNTRPPRPKTVKGYGENDA